MQTAIKVEQLNPKEKVMLLHRLAKTAAMFLTPHSAPKKVI